jgi:hypothetical protein
MRFSLAALSAVAGLAIAGAVGIQAPALAQGQAHVGPQAMINEHRVIERNLRAVAHEHGRVGIAAQHVLTVIVPHERHEEEFVLPLLGLVDSIVDSGVNQDMAWAVDMSNRVKADRASFTQEHEKVVAALDELATAARRQHDRRLVAFCESVAAHAVDDNEVVIPTAILVGTHVAEKLGIKK